MTELIVCLGDESSDAYVKKLIDLEDWENIILVSDDKKKTFKSAKKVSLVYVDSSKKLKEIVNELVQAFAKETKGIEVAVNIVAAKGKIGMAVVSALVSSGKGIRLVAWSQEGLVVF